MRDRVDSIIADRTSETGRRWSFRDVSGANHRAEDPTTALQTLIAAGRGVDRDGIASLLEPSLRAHMPDPDVLTDMAAAARRLAAAILRSESILVFGDYDVDGATSTAILQRFLRDAGASSYAIQIPDREDGYGFGGESCERAIEQMPDLLVLLDCGTQNHDGIAAARDAGCDVVVVDHHQPAATLPAANALVNPHRADETEAGSALRNLCTAGLAFMLVVATNRDLRRAGWYADRAEPDLPTLLDLVALGTVCDVMKLTGLNRAFVRAGLKRLDARANPGLSALAEVAGVKRGATVNSFGFHLGPRINAGGRVGKARLGADMLSSEDPAECASIAAELNRLNAERQSIEKRVQEEATAMVDPSHEVIVVAGRGWHEGVIGIVAGRIKEIHNRPTIVMAVRDDGVVKGSGRSVPGVDLGTAVMKARSEGLLVAGGGHQMACGLTGRAEDVEAFSAWLREELGRTATNARATSVVPIDAAIHTTDVTEGMIDEVEALGPYGQGWPKPRFVLGPLRTSSPRSIKGGHVFLDLVDENGTIPAKAWKAEDTGLAAALQSERRMLVIGHAEIDEFRGRREAQIIIEDVMLLDDAVHPGARKSFSLADILIAG